MNYTYQNYMLEIAQKEFFLGTQNFNDTSESNEEVLTLLNIIKNVMSSAAEEELGEFFTTPKQGNQ